MDLKLIHEWVLRKTSGRKLLSQRSLHYYIGDVSRNIYSKHDKAGHNVWKRNIDDDKLITPKGLFTM